MKVWLWVSICTLFAAVAATPIMLVVTGATDTRNGFETGQCRVMHDFEVDGADFRRIGPDAPIGAWVLTDGAIVAWSHAEDGALWERPECVRSWPR